MKFARFGRGILVGSLLFASLLVLFSSQAPPATASGEGWLSGYQYRRAITISHDNIDSDLDNFPVTVFLDSTNFNFDNVSFENGQDLRFTASDGTTELDYEIEEFSKSGENGIIHVRIPSVSSTTDTTFYMYYGNASASDGQNPSGVWDDNYKLVTHMKDDPDTSHIADSTSNGNNGTKYAAGEPTEADGKIDNAQDFDGTDDYISISPNDAVKIDGDFTWEFWMNTNDTTSPHIISSGNTTSGTHLELSSGSIRLDIFDTTSGEQDFHTTATFNDGGWHHVVAIFQTGETDGIDIYVDDVLQGGSYNDQTAVTHPEYLTNFAIGIYCADLSSVPYDGLLDEVRVSNTPRSAAWIKASYYSEDDNLLSVGSEEASGGGGGGVPAMNTIGYENVAPENVDLKGELENKGGNASVDVFFQYRVKGVESWDNNEGDKITLTIPDNYSLCVTGLTSNTTYEYRAIGIGSDNDNIGYGSTLEFTTENWITIYTLTSTENLVDRKQDVEWASPALTTTIQAYITAWEDIDENDIDIIIYDANDTIEENVNPSPLLTVDKFRENPATGNTDYPQRLNDNDVSAGGWGSIGEYWEVDWGVQREIDQYRYYGWDGQAGGEYVGEVKLQYWDGSNWIDHVENIPSRENTWSSWIDFPAVTTSKIRIVVTYTDSAYVIFMEWEIREENFLYVYNPRDDLDNLGYFDVQIYATDSSGHSDNRRENQLFVVDDFDNTVVPSQENIAGHRQRIYETAALVTGGSVTLTAGRRIDSNDGTENATVSGANFENTWAPSGSGSVYFELETAELDGRTDNLTYVFPNFSPEVIYYSSSEAVVDRKKDDAASSPTLTTDLKVRIKDVDNRSDLDSARLLVRDATDAVQENSDVWSTATVVDENTLEFTLTGFDPANTLADGALGSWDVGGSATDKYGGSVLDWDAGTFVVDDLTVSGITFTPENADLGITWGYDLTVSATVTRVSGTVSLDNSWVDDAAEGTFNAGSGASVTYLIDGSDPGDTVSVDFRAWDSPLDGTATSSYTLTENRVYNWAIYYEENAESYSLLENRTYTLNVYFTDGTGEHETISSNSGQIVVNKPVFEISIDDDNDESDANDYWRTLIPQLGENLDFLLVGPEDLESVYRYTFTLIDYTGSYGPDENGFVAFKKTLNYQMTVSSEYWSPLNSSASQFLIQGTRYQVVLYGTGNQVRDLHWFTATSTYVQDITVRPLTPENAVYIRDLLSWAAWRDEQTIYITYYDGFENTENVTISVYVMGTDDCVFSTTEYLDNVEIEFADAENEQSYRVELDAWHGDFGHLSETKTVGPNLSGYTIPTPPFDIGSPIPLMALLSVAIVALVALTFGGLFAPQAMLAIAATVSLLILVGWLQLDWKIAAFLWVIGFVFLFGRSKG